MRNVKTFCHRDHRELREVLENKTLRSLLLPSPVFTSTALFFCRPRSVSDGYWTRDGEKNTKFTKGGLFFLRFLRLFVAIINRFFASAFHHWINARS
jgi:hypothetical protein